MCAAEPGLIVRHHDFENYPVGTTPHTTAPLDYLILTLAAVLRRWTAQPMDLAGALISPLFALLGGWFLWWWSRRMKLADRWTMLILYAISPILVHGTRIGPARSSIFAHAADNHRSLCRMDFVVGAVQSLERGERSDLGSGHLGFGLRAAYLFVLILTLLSHSDVSAGRPVVGVVEMSSPSWRLGAPAGSHSP